MPETINSRAADVREHIDKALQILDRAAISGQEWSDAIVMLQHASLIAEGIEADTDEES